MTPRDIDTDQSDSFELEALFFSLPDPVFIYSYSKKRFLKANHAAVKRYGYSQEEFLDMGPWDISPYADVEIVSLLDSMRGRSGTVIRTEHRTRAGAVFPIEIHASSHSKNGDYFNIAICRELTERIESEKRLEKAETHYRAIFENSMALICVADLKATTFTDVNPAFEQLLGYTREELLSQPFTNFIHADDLESTLKVVEEELLLGKRFIFFQNRYRTKNGQYVWLDWSSQPLPDQGVVYAVAHDITQQKRIEERLRQQNQRMRLHVEQTLLGVIEWDLDFCVKEWNHGAEQIFGYSKKEAMGRHGSFLLSDNVRLEVDTIWQKLLKGKGGELYKNGNVRKDGAELVCEWINTSLVGENGKVVGVASLVFNVTEAEHRKRDLEIAKDMAEKANQAKSEFLSMMSHELRTPLNSIVGPCQLLQLKDRDESSSKLLDVMLASSSHLLDLINKILDLSKIESGAVEIEPQALRVESFLKQQLLPLSTVAEKKGLQFSVECSFSKNSLLVTDGRLLTQALINLVGNSIKFTEKGDIWVRAGLSARGVCIEVEDTGVGMSDDLMDRLFEPFRQETLSLSYESEGTGLGLSITKSLIEKLKGRIEVQSTIGHGSLFRILLPQLDFIEGDSSSVDFLESGFDEGRSVCPRVLLVEDEPRNQVVGSEMLEFLGYDFDLAETGEESVELFIKNGYDIILMDMRLPGIDGMEAAKKIRAHAKSEVIIIAQSAYALTQQKETLLREGMDDYISKPISLDILRDTLVRAAATLA